MKRNSILILTLSLICLLPVGSLAQKKKPAPRRPTQAEPRPAPVMDMRPEAQKVSEQIKNVSKFLFIYGKFVNGLEVADDLTKRGEMTPTAAAKNQQSKDALITNIRGLRAGIETLAKTLQANPRLQVQYLKISYAAEAVANAEQLAVAGRWDESGKALSATVERLMDTVMAMRLM